MLTKLKSTIASALLLAVADAAPVLAQGAQPAPNWDWPGPWHMMWGGWGFWWVFPLLMMVFIALCIFLMARMPWGHRHSHGDHTSSALQLLSERFAKGEISKEEFEEKRAILLRRT